MNNGVAASLAAAAFWAVASLLYGRTPLTAWGMNYGKNLIATGILSVHLLVHAGITGAAVLTADGRAWTVLGLSGLIGIVAGDTLYFRSLQILGPRRALIVSTASPLFTAVLGRVFLDQNVSITSGAGILLTLTGIACVVLDRQTPQEAPGLYPGSIRNGVVAGLAAAFLNATGAVLSRVGMENCDPLQATFIRLAASAGASLLLVVIVGRFVPATRVLLQKQVLIRFVPAVMCGTWLGIWLSQIGYRLTDVAVANTLTCTTPLFVMPLVRVIHGHRITWLGLSGTAIALVGISLTSAGST